MKFTELKAEIPEALVQDFASDPLSPYDKVRLKIDDVGWPLHRDLSQFLARLPPQAIEASYADKTFVALYEKDERLARVFFTQRLLVEEAARRRLKSLTEPSVSTKVMPYSADCLRDVRVDAECMVRLAEFEYNGSTVIRNGFSFMLCPTKESLNSTYWLLESFYKRDVAKHMSVRLDPFLWGPLDHFPQLMYRMLVYAKPLNWDGISQLRAQHHGQMRADRRGGSELTEFSWDPRDDGIHFICEELPARERVEFSGARYLHAIYDPRSQLITHFDGAVRIYTEQQLADRHKEHLRKSGKTGLRRKIFRIDEPINRDSFSLIAQAFFVWNDDLATYFGETLSA